MAEQVFLAVTKAGMFIPIGVCETRRDAIIAVRKNAHKYAGSSKALQIAWMRQVRILRQDVLPKQQRRRQKGRNVQRRRKILGTAPSGKCIIVGVELV